MAFGEWLTNYFQKLFSNIWFYWPAPWYYSGIGGGLFVLLNPYVSLCEPLASGWRKKYVFHLTFLRYWAVLSIKIDLTWCRIPIVNFLVEYPKFSFVNSSAEWLIDWDPLHCNVLDDFQGILHIAFIVLAAEGWGSLWAPQPSSKEISTIPSVTPNLLSRVISLLKQSYFRKD